MAPTTRAGTDTYSISGHFSSPVPLIAVHRSPALAKLVVGFLMDTRNEMLMICHLVRTS